MLFRCARAGRRFALRNPQLWTALMNDRIRELGFLLRVTDEASFSAAARAPDLDPSTISMVIQRL